MSKENNIIINDEVLEAMGNNLEVALNLEMKFKMMDGKGLREILRNIETFYPKAYELMEPNEVANLIEVSYMWDKLNDDIFNKPWSEEFVLTYGLDYVRIAIIKEEYDKLNEFFSFVESISSTDETRETINNLLFMLQMLEQVHKKIDEQKNNLN